MVCVWWCLAITLTYYVHALPCKFGRERFDNSCYQLLSGIMNWQDASRACSDTCLGGGLAVPDSLDEHLFIWKWLNETVSDRNLGIGCHREGDKWIQDGKGGPWGARSRLPADVGIQGLTLGRHLAQSRSKVCDLRVPGDSFHLSGDVL